MTTRLFWLSLPLAFAVACGGDKSSTGTSTTDADADADADADTDTDTDSDADTDADTDADVESNLVVDVVATVGGNAYEDSCVGSLTASDDGSAITGSGTCAFVGPLSALLSGDQSGTLQGTIGGDGTASGVYELVISGSTVSLNWTGTAGDATVDGVFSGADALTIGSTSVELAYEGTFTYDR